MSPLGLDAWITVAVLVAAFALFLRKGAPVEIVALAIPVVLFAARVLPEPGDALAGFGNRAVVAIAAVMVVGAGLQESGVTTLLARGIQTAGGRREATLVLALMGGAVALSSVMSTTSVVALFVPVAMTLSRRTLVPPSRLMMPVAFAAVLGGNLMLVSSAPNMLVADHARSVLDTRLGVFDFTPAGVAITLAGVAYMVFVGRRLLPVRTAEDRLAAAQLPEEVVRSYGLARNMFRMKVVARSSVAGRTIAASGIRDRYSLDVVMVARERRLRHEYLEPAPDLVLLEGDDLYLEGGDENAWRFADYETVQYGLAGPAEIERILGRGMTVAEVTLAPRSQAVGHSFRDLAFRTRHGLTVLSLWRRGASAEEPIADVPLEHGDAFIVSGPTSRVAGLAREADFLVLTDAGKAEDARRAPIAIALLAASILPPLLGIAPLALSALAAAVLMVVLGCTSVQAAYRAVDWKILFIIIGTIPLGLALDRTGVAAAVARILVDACAPLGPVALVAGTFGLAMLTSMATTHATAAVLVAPIAGKAAAAAGLPLETALLAVAYGCSCAFMLPFHLWNLTVSGPGGYRTRDFLVVGSGMTAVVALTAVAALSLLR